MKDVLKNIGIWLLPVFSLFSCADKSVQENDEPGHSNGTFINLNIRSLTRAAQTDGGPVEMIDRVRVIIINDANPEEPIIEYNKLIDFLEPEVEEEGNVSPGASQPAGDFYYRYSLPSFPGHKLIYVFANEESVGELSYNPGLEESGIEFDSAKDTPDTKSLTSMLAYYQQGDIATDFLTLMKSIYFTPEYVSEDGEVYLPYSTNYDITLEKGQSSEKTLYLVPVAVKFTFNFTNHREAAVRIQQIQIGGIAKNNYLNANLASGEQNKTVGDGTQTMWWVDWLAEVSRFSNLDENIPKDPNSSLNSAWGWIDGFYLPPGAYDNEPLPIYDNGFEKEEFYSYAQADLGEIFPEVKGTLGESGETSDPGHLSVTGIYFPESCFRVKQMYDNFGKPLEGELAQIYFLTLTLQENSVNINRNLGAINTLASLFRNTHVIINITLKQGVIEAYAQIQPWVVTEVNGWLTEVPEED